MALLGAKDVLDRVESRLTLGGGVVELDQFHRLSSVEVDVLLRLERESVTQEGSVAA